MAGVFRFSNAVSDIKKFTSTYKTIYSELKDKENFTHDDATNALIKHGLVSSSGAIGLEAVNRSRREDRSRDPLYNQLKMYSEIYRMLGWYEPGTQNTNFNIPDYGQYIFEANNQLLIDHFELNVLHIVSPNPLVEIRGRNILRPFPLILKILDKCDSLIHRDEIILTVLACESDKQPGHIQKAADYILNLRGDINRLETAYEELMKKHGVNSKDVFRNYTRFVMATLKYLGYADAINLKGVYGDKAIKFYKQTEIGKLRAAHLMGIVDIRNSDLEEYDLDERSAFTAYSVYHHLGRLGYDLSDPETQEMLLKIKEICRPILEKYNLAGGNDFLYFGYQESTKEEKERATTLLV